MKNVSDSFSDKALLLEQKNKQKREYAGRVPPEYNQIDVASRVPLLHLPSVSENQQPTSKKLRRIRLLSSSRWNESAEVRDFPTSKMPEIQAGSVAYAATVPLLTVSVGAESPDLVLRKLVKSSGIYAFASVAPSLVTLILAPFLTRHLPQSDYGAFILLTTFISLTAGITQLGLGSAFFRAYSYDYPLDKDRRDVLATVTSLLLLASSIIVVGSVIFAPFLAGILLGQSSYSNLIVIAATIVCAQNLSVPIFSWLRAENHPVLFSSLAISNVLITLISSLLLVGVVSLGITGALIASGSGYACVAMYALLFVLRHVGLRIRFTFARSMLAFGVPLVLNVISSWTLQVLDRYLLSLFSSLVQTAEYAVAYSLGSALSIVIITPFGLAWPSVMFSIAKRKDSALVFRQTFRLFSMLLLFAAFGLSLAAKTLLLLLFPSAYQACAFIIPIIALSLVFYGVYNVFIIGINIQRKTWLIGIYSAAAAISNVALNLVLIPRYQAMGAAIATLLAYIVIATVAYLVNQRIYPIPFEIGKFTSALLLGVFLFAGGSLLLNTHSSYLDWSIAFISLCIYGSCLFAIAKPPLRMRWFLRLRKGERV